MSDLTPADLCRAREEGRHEGYPMGLWEGQANARLALEQMRMLAERANETLRIVEAAVTANRPPILESESCAFLRYETDRAQIVAVYEDRNAWVTGGPKEFGLNRESAEQRLVNLELAGDVPDVTQLVLRQWPVKPPSRWSRLWHSIGWKER